MEESSDIVPAVKEINPEKRKINRSKKNANMVVAEGPKIIMDMQFGALMNDHTTKKLISQISLSYAFDKNAKESLPMIFTSMDDKWRDYINRVNGNMWSNKIIQYKDVSVVDAFPKEDLIYLTADTDNICTSLDPHKCYIIGCLIDHNSHKNITRDYAERHNLRMERLPIPEHITMDGRQVLTVNQVVEILVRYNNNKDWTETLLQVIPQRKNPRPVHPIKQSEQEKPKEKSSFCRIV